MSDNLLIAYTELLHKHRDLDASPVVDFLDKHENNHTFQRRVAILNKLYLAAIYQKAKKVFEALTVGYRKELTELGLEFGHFTCADCGHVTKCKCAFDFYYESGDCLMEK